MSKAGFLRGMFWTGETVKPHNSDGLVRMSVGWNHDNILKVALWATYQVEWATKYLCWLVDIGKYTAKHKGAYDDSI